MSSTYILPQVRVFQQLIPTTMIGKGVRRAVVIGPDYQTVEYENATLDEKQRAQLGTYNQGAEQNYLWPNRPAGGIVDQDWTKLFLENAWLQYWSNPAPMTVPATGDSNRVAGDLNLVSYETYDRHPTLLNRDVRLGDGVRISGTGTDSEAYEIYTRVTGFQHEQLAASVGDSVAYANNQTNTTQDETGTQIDGVINTVEAIPDGTAYDGRVAGYVSETYTVEVIQGGVGTGARLRVTSASGTDNQASVVPAAFGGETAIGTRGLVVAFDTSGDASSADGETFPEDEFVVGQTWVFTVSQDYTIPAHVSGGTYTGTRDTTYIVEVIRGGSLTASAAADRPRIAVTTTTGVDIGGPYTVSSGTAVTIGSFGVQITFTGAGLVRGDRFSVPASATANGPIRTLLLAESMPDELLGQTVAVDLFIRGNYEVSRRQIDGSAGNHFEQSSTELTVAESLQVFDHTWTNEMGDMVALSVHTGTLYVQYRALRMDNTTRLRLYSAADLPSRVSPNSPFYYGLSKALQNSNGTAVFGLAVAQDTRGGYQDALSKIGEEWEAYSIIPLTKDRGVHADVADHIGIYSTPETGRWRRGLLNSDADTILPVYTTTNSDDYTAVDGTPVLAVVEDDPNTSGTQYTRVLVENGAFLTAGVRAGDVVRMNYSVDDFGDPIFETYEIDRVVSEDQLILMTGPSQDVPIASKIEIWRPLSRDEVARGYGRLSQAFYSRRIGHAWPDYVTADGGQVVPGYFLLCAYGGLRSGVEPHRPLTNVEIVGFEDVPRSTDYFNNEQLNIMAGMGTLIFTRDRNTGRIFVRHQVTTGNYDDVKQREESFTTNQDDMSYQFLQEFGPMIGRSNISPALLDIIGIRLSTLGDTFLQVNDRLIGPRALSVEIAELRQHEVLLDRVVARFHADLPAPFNNMDLTIVS